MAMPCTRCGPERVHRHGGHQRGVDPAREADDRLAETVLRQVVVGAQDQGGVDLGVIAQGRADRWGRQHRPVGLTLVGDVDAGQELR